MKTSEIRDRLLEQRALYQQSLKAAEEEKKSFKEVIRGITEEQREIMRKVLGADFLDPATIDLDRIQNDREYFNTCQERYIKMLTELHDYLEAALNDCDQ